MIVFRCVGYLQVSRVVRWSFFVVDICMSLEGCESVVKKNLHLTQPAR